MAHHSSFMPRAAVAAVLLALASASHAALTAFTSASSFAAATTASAVGNFSGLPNDPIASPSTRTVGAYGYTASAPGGLFGSGTLDNPWLSTKLSGDTLTFGSLTGGV